MNAFVVVVYRVWENSAQGDTFKWFYFLSNIQKREDIHSLW